MADGGCLARRLYSPLYSSYEGEAIVQLSLCDGGPAWREGYEAEVIGPAIESEFVVDPVALFDGPAATIAASVPARLVDAIRAQAGKGEFSRVVTIALARWLVDRNRAAYVESFEADHGPLDPVVVAQIEAALKR